MNKLKLSRVKLIKLRKSIKDLTLQIESLLQDMEPTGVVCKTTAQTLFTIAVPLQKLQGALNELRPNVE